MHVPPNVPQNREVDLLHDQWSMSDFERSTFSVAEQGNKISIFAAQVLKKEETPAKPNWVGMMRSWGATMIGAQTSTNLFAISQAINKKALNYIQKVTSLEWSPSLPEKIEKMRKALQELKVLRQNLVAHDDYIAKCNQSLFLKDKSFASCPNHEDVLREVDVAIKKTQKLLKKFTSDKAQQFLDQAIRELQKDIQEGKSIDRYYIRDKYPKIELEMEKLLPDIKLHYQNKYHLIMNQAYLKGLVTQIESGKMQLPTTFREGLRAIGISYAEQDKVLLGAKKQLLQALKEKLSPQEEKKLQSISPSQLVQVNQAVVLTIAAQVIKSPKSEQLLDPKAQERLKLFLSTLHDYEVKLLDVWKKSLASSLAKVFGDIPADLPKEFKDNCVDQLAQIKGEDQMSEIFQRFLSSLPNEQGKALGRSLTDLPDDQFNLLLQSFKQQFFNKGSEEIQQACDQSLTEKLNRMVTSHHRDMLESHLQSLKKLLANGFEVDRDFIARDYPRFETLVKKLPPQEQESYRREYHLEVNRAYLHNLIEKVTEKKMPLPFTIQKGLIALGYTDQDQENVLEEGRVKVLTALHQLQRPDMLIISPQVMVKHVQGSVFDTTAHLLLNKKTKKPLNASERERLIRVLDLIRKFEVSLSPICQLYFSMGIDNALASLPDDTPEEMMAFYRKELQKMPIEDRLAELMDAFFQLDSSKKLKGALWEMSDEQFATLAKDIDINGNLLLEVIGEIPAIKQMFDSDFINRLAQLEFKPYFDWFNDNNSNCIFRFNQGAWGNDEVLGGGICLAITYGWMKEMQKNPDRAIRSLEDLGMAMGPSGVPQMGINRFVQASYSVSVYKSEIGGTDLPHMLKKKDKVEVKHIPIPPKQSIRELIKEVDRLEKEKGINISDSKGVIKVGASNATSAHALFMRFNHPNGRYAFGDVNEGMWEYSSLDEMSNAFESYLKVKYPGKERFTQFKASQYLFEISSTNK